MFNNNLLHQNDKFKCVWGIYSAIAQPIFELHQKFRV